MRVIARDSPLICARCLRARAKPVAHVKAVGGRHESTTSSPPKPDGQEKGAMSRRLADMSERSLETGGRSARKAVEEAGFSEELKRRLQEKIADASFKSGNAAAFAQSNLPASAPKQVRDIAGARPWSGTESVEDASLRMLNDAHKPLRMPVRSSGVRAPQKVDTGRPAQRAGTGVRLANARDRSSVYTVLKDPSMSEDEREKYRAELKQRFTPHARTARTVPATIQGLQSLANERIEDAIARGQFKNLPRGQKIERDYNANSPFINTTEYFMNKIIQKQDIVPPWIEKQQELVSTATKFRARLRTEWRRHVARTISSRGGTLEAQMKLAEEYARAEAISNPPKKKVEQINTVNGSRLTQITLSEDHASAAANTGAEEVKVIEQPVNDDGSLNEADAELKITTLQAEPAAPPPQRPPTIHPFRDSQWEATERGYLQAAINELNSLTRSYNLMAPELAKKTYYSLERELKSCYADVAPQVAVVIRERAYAPKIKGVEVIGHKPGGVLSKFSGTTAPVYDEKKPLYGFKEFWRDLFTKN